MFRSVQGEACWLNSRMPSAHRHAEHRIRRESRRAAPRLPLRCVLREERAETGRFSPRRRASSHGARRSATARSETACLNCTISWSSVGHPRPASKPSSGDVANDPAQELGRARPGVIARALCPRPRTDSSNTRRRSGAARTQRPDLEQLANSGDACEFNQISGQAQYATVTAADRICQTCPHELTVRWLLVGCSI